MGLLSKIAFGASEPIVTAKVVFMTTSYAELTIEKVSAEAGSDDFIAFVLFHYAKMLFVVPKNYFGITPYLNTMLKVTKSEEFRKDMIFGFNAVIQDFEREDRGSKTSDRTYITELFRSKGGVRSIKTHIPMLGPTSQALLSVNQLILGFYERLSDKDVVRMKHALHDMSAEYLNGTDYRALRNLNSIPAKALEEASKVRRG